MNKQIKTETGICHLRVTESVRLRDFLLTIDLSPLEIHPDASLIDEWLHYGSIYLEGRRLREDCDLRPQQIVRLHTRRKTYVAEIPRLIERINFQNGDFLVLDKPAGLPTHATLDNCIENACHLLSSQLHIPLYVTHRLDVATQGLLILAKTPKAQAALNKQFAKKQVLKIYNARTAAHVPLGLHTHWINPESRVPKEVSATARSGWWECRLEILTAQASNEGYSLKINLLTGKTHQIRAQLSALGAPIDGDSVYGSHRSGTLALACVEMSLRWMQEELVFRRK